MARNGKTLRPRERAPHGPRVALELILIDQAPLRSSAAFDCATATARLAEARAAWHRFEREDKPAFVRWRAREFGSLLSEARDVEAQIRDCQALVHEVEMEMRRFFQDPRSAYQRVMFRRQNPGAVEEDAPREPADAGAAQPLSEFEQEALFQEWVQRSLGTNPDKMDDEAYTTSFETFKAHMFQPRAPQPPPNAARRPEPTAQRAEPVEEEVDPAIDARVKVLYRALVRRLHPDLRADRHAAVSALWHEVQEAYAASDVARMELLLALSDLESSHLSEQTTLAQMRAVFAELTRAIRALEKSVEEAQGEDAWDFARSGARPDLRLRVQRELKSDLAARSLRLSVLTRTIADWARGPAANRHAVVRRAPQFARQP